MNFLNFTIPTIIQIYIIILILRFWMQSINLTIYNPFTEFIIKITDTFLSKIQKILPVNDQKIITFIIAYILTLFNLLFSIWYAKYINLITFNILFIGIIELLYYFGRIVFWFMLIRSILNFINYQYHYNSINNTLFYLTEFFLVPIRKFLPLIGGIDFSIAILLLLLVALNHLRIDILLFIDPNLTKIIYSIQYLI
ncbi:MAG: YggT family protein [Arsenophonus sp.]|nr:MAG: YggT family protein [Arsenophonus sp.]